MKFNKIIAFLFVGLLFFCSFGKAHAIYDPLSVKNNIFGIHILFPSELSEAAYLVNSNGGDWGYVTIPMEASDKDLTKWQEFMDNCKKYHLIPIIRIATTDDYFSKTSWSKPTDYDVLDFANFLNSLNWPTKNRYVVIFNEPNRGDEWGGTPDASEYAQILNYAVDVFKRENQDFFIISAGLDNAAANVPGQSISDYTFMYEMNQAVPGIFGKIDGMASHSYPNPGFSMPPSSAREGVDSFYYQEQLAKQFSGKDLPVFITETGWSSNEVSEEQQSQYYIQTFANYWDNPDIVAVTPFVFDAQQGDFSQFSFIGASGKNKIYYAYYNLPKQKGEPELTPYTPNKTSNQAKFPTETFKSSSPMDSLFKTVNPSARKFFKWLLGV